MSRRGIHLPGRSIITALTSARPGPASGSGVRPGTAIQPRPEERFLPETSHTKPAKPGEGA